MLPPFLEDIFSSPFIRGLLTQQEHESQDAQEHVEQPQLAGSIFDFEVAKGVWAVL